MSNPMTTEDQSPRKEEPRMKCICTREGEGCTNRCDRGQWPPIPAIKVTIKSTTPDPAATDGDALNRLVRVGDLPAPITNPEAWPPGYADGFNDYARHVDQTQSAALSDQRVGEAVGDGLPPKLVPTAELFELLAAAKDLCEHGHGDTRMRDRLRKSGKAFDAARCTLQGKQPLPPWTRGEGTVTIGQTRCYAGDEWFRELTVAGVTFLAPLDNWEAASHLLATKNPHPAPPTAIPDCMVVGPHESLRYLAYATRGMQVCCGHGQQVSENEIACCGQPVDAGEELGKLLVAAAPGSAEGE